MVNEDGRERGARLVEQIYEARARARRERRPRRLGHSAMGAECDRRIWASFRWLHPLEEIDGQTQRRFETGDLAEARFVDDLKYAGASVFATDVNGDQHSVESARGHHYGKLDGIATDVPFQSVLGDMIVVEFKTHGDASFGRVKKHGVKDGAPAHWAQVQGYLRDSCLGEALYLAVRKETDELYAEYVAYDEAAGKTLLERAEDIINRKTPPPRISKKPDFYLCKMCPAKGWCHDGEDPVRTCRSCRHIVVQPGGGWRCGLKDKLLSSEEQELACDYYQPLESLEDLQNEAESSRPTG